MSNLYSRLQRLGIVRVLRHRSFSYYMAAHFASATGLWVQRIAIQWLAWYLSGSYVWLGIIALAEASTIFISSLVGGPLADRVDRVKFSLVTQFLLMAAACSLAACVFLDWITLPVLAGFVMVTGFIEGIWAPVRLALVPNLVPREDIPAAVSLSSMTFMVAVIIGPAIAGILIATIGSESAFLLNAASYVGLMLVFMRLKLHTQQLPKSSSSFIEDLKFGFVYVATTRALRSVVIVGFVFSLLVRPFRDLLAGIADGIFHAGPEGLAALASASGIGGLIGSIAIAVYGKTTGLSRTLIYVAALCAVLLLLLSLSQSFVLTMSLIGALTFCAAVFGTSAQMLIQMSINDNVRGRVMSVWLSQFRNAPSLGAFLIGVCEPMVGLRTVLFGCAVLFLVFVVLNATKQSGLHELELEPASNPT